MNALFADTFYFLALFNPRDAAHERARGASRGLCNQLLTTDWVLTEMADALSDPKNRQMCSEFINDIRRSKRIEVVSASRIWFDTGWEMYTHHLDKGWSLTDCISFAVMRDRHMTEALTGDHHFEQAGFRALLK